MGRDTISVNFQIISVNFFSNFFHANRFFLRIILLKLMAQHTLFFLNNIKKYR